MSDDETSWGRIDAEVVIPLKWASAGDRAREVEEMSGYLRGLHRTVTSITVVDGSEDDAFEAHHQAWDPYARVIRPDADVRAQVRRSPDGGERGCVHAPTSRKVVNGKVIGALTGIREARHELVVLADDDVRHTPDTIARLVAALEDADLVRPVNVYDAWPWQARWDGARALLNHAVAVDWPGTFALRRSAVLARGGWCPETLFENLELWRTMEAGGGRVRSQPRVCVPRRPPSVSQFWSQRVRQAYDDFAQPARLALELAIMPTALGLLLIRPNGLVVVAAASVALAEGGRRRLGSDRVPPSVPLWAPLWVLERGVCAWVAVGSRLRGGARYHGRRLGRAAHTSRQLRLAFSGTSTGEPAAARPALGSAGRDRPRRLVPRSLAACEARPTRHRDGQRPLQRDSQRDTQRDAQMLGRVGV